MENLAWGLMMLVVGMGVVFLLLAVLMGTLMLMGRLDRPPAPEPVAPAPAELELEASAPGTAGGGEAAAAPVVRIIADGLDEAQVAAISIAVITHAETRRRKAAPETRLHAPGSQLFASRWLAVGRAHQTQPSTRR